MPPVLTDARRELHASLSARLQRCSDGEIFALAGERPNRPGWGTTSVLEIDGNRVFLKRIPVTRREFEAGLSTANLYEIPTFYNYGVGSAGFGVGRELAAAQKSSRLVLDGEVEGIPLLYHHRVLRSDAAKAPLDEDQAARYRASWGDSEGIDRYMRDRAAADHELFIFLEYFPETGAPHLLAHPEAVEDVVAQLFQTIGVLRSHGMVHFDAHFQNVVTDGTTYCLTDFGLALDADFELSPDERTNLRRHTDYDYGEVLYGVGAQLLWRFWSETEEHRSEILDALGLAGGGPLMRIDALVANAEAVGDIIPLDPGLLRAVVRYRPVSLFMDDFFETLRANPRKDTPFDEQRLARLLDEAGVTRPALPR